MNSPKENVTEYSQCLPFLGVPFGDQKSSDKDLSENIKYSNNFGEAQKRLELLARLVGDVELPSASEASELSMKARQKACQEELRYKMNDPVNHPNHYMSDNSGIECIDAIQASLTKEQFIGFCKGNAMKYIWRAGKKKGSEDTDMRKAEWYCKKAYEVE